MTDTIGFILLWMIFMHIVDDYYLQGWLASAKQKDYWVKNYPDKLYQKDYMAALVCHAFSWSFMINLPLVLYKYNNIIIGTVLVNMIIHAFVDNLKANRKKINLIIDQSIHIIQIIITYCIYLLLIK